jgi:sulfonate dioxygenase
VFPEPTFFEHVDPGLRADPDFPDLLPPGVARVDHLTPVIGTEVFGVQLSSLSDVGRGQCGQVVSDIGQTKNTKLTLTHADQLALYVAQRGVVVFRNQNFAHISPERQLEFVRHFGPHYLHPSDRHPKDLPEYYSIFQDAA